MHTRVSRPPTGLEKGCLLTPCAVWDLINVAEIHNSTFDPNDLVTADRFSQLQHLANAQQWGLAYNATDDMRAVAGMTLAAKIVDFLNETIETQGQSKLGVQFGSYGTFLSFFGLAQLPDANPDFTGVPGYASAMAFELFTNQSLPTGTWPTAEQLYVRFLFHNGTTSAAAQPAAYPLFGQDREVLSWKAFADGINAFAIRNDEQWCTKCGNFTGECAAYDPDGAASSSSSCADGAGAAESGGQSGNGLSPAVNGVIGAMVTLAVVLGLEALVVLVGGLRLVSKKRLGPGSSWDAQEVAGAGGQKAA